MVAHKYHLVPRAACLKSRAAVLMPSKIGCRVPPSHVPRAAVPRAASCGSQTHARVRLLVVRNADMVCIERK